ncbi:hypothetical protein J6590_044036, partial [Homalodisca vitripennis]
LVIVLETITNVLLGLVRRCRLHDLDSGPRTPSTLGSSGPSSSVAFAPKAPQHSPHPPLHQQPLTQVPRAESQNRTTRQPLTISTLTVRIVFANGRNFSTRFLHQKKL